MHVLADPIVCALLKEFKQAVDRINELRDSQTPQRAIDLVTQLCELAREIRFHFGPVKYADPVQLQEAAAELDKAVEAIQSLQIQDQPNLVVYCRNIQERADYFREGVTGTPG